MKRAFIGREQLRTVLEQLHAGFFRGEILRVNREERLR